MSGDAAEGRRDWEGKYTAGETPWNRGAPPPALLELIAELGRPGRRVLVVGAGYGHDAIAWAVAGHRVTAVDIAPTAVDGARRLAAKRGITLDVVHADLLAMPPAYVGAFDIVWEHTCFCALEPADRPKYVDAVAAALRPRGTFLGILWNRGGEGGPPYDVTRAQVREAFDEAFEILSLESVSQSFEGRDGEFLARMIRR